MMAPFCLKDTHDQATSTTILRNNSELSAQQQQDKPTIALASGHGFVGLTRLSPVGGIRFGRKSGR